MFKIITEGIFHRRPLFLKGTLLSTTNVCSKAEDSRQTIHQKKFRSNTHLNLKLCYRMI